MRLRTSTLCLTFLLGFAGFPAQAGIEIRLDGNVRVGQATSVDVLVLGEGDFALGGASPRAWLVPDPDGACAPPAAGIFRSELDGLLLILRNSDNTISAVDPDRELASGNIVWLTSASEPIDRWQVDGDGGLVRIWHDGSESFESLNLSDGSIIANPLAYPEQGNPGEGEDPLMASSALARKIFRIDSGSQNISAQEWGDSNFTDFATLRAPADRIRISPDGRWLFAFTPDNGLIQVVDIALGRQTHALALHAGFSQTEFTDDYLYLREAERAYVSMIRLTSLTEAEAHVVAIPVGLMPSADPMAPIGTDGMAFLNSAERAVYLYMESGMSDGHGTMRSPTEMLAPYDVVQIRGSIPVDLGIYDRSLREVRPGHFRSSISPPHGGLWRLVVRDRQSELVGCLDFEVEGPASPSRQSEGVGLIATAPGQPVFRVTGAEHVDLPPRFAMLAMVPGTNWQRRVTAIRMADGDYRVEETLPRGTSIILLPTGLRQADAPLSLGPLL